jgi:hypothetical protein
MVYLKNLVLLVLCSVIITCTGNKKQNTTTAADELAATNVAENTVNAPAIKKYQIKSGIVTLYNEAMGIKSKVVLYFDDYGMKEAEEKYDGETIKEATLCDGKKRYIVVYKDKTAYESGDCYRGVAYKFDWAEVEQAPDKYKAKKLPNINIAGKDCESFSLQSGKSPIVYAGWNNICFMIDQESSFGKITYKAASIEENVTIPEGKLTVPEGFEVKKSPI